MGNVTLARIKPSNIVTLPDGVIDRRERLGGMLSYYYREAA